MTVASLTLYSKLSTDNNNDDNDDDNGEDDDNGNDDDDGTDCGKLDIVCKVVDELVNVFANHFAFGVINVIVILNIWFQSTAMNSGIFRVIESN